MKKAKIVTPEPQEGIEIKQKPARILVEILVFGHDKDKPKVHELNNELQKQISSHRKTRARARVFWKINNDESGPNIALLKQYASLIKTYQTKSKKEKLNIYIMSDSYSIISQFQLYGDPSWKITSLSKNIPKDIETTFIQSLAEIQIMCALPALILDFNFPSDRFIYLMKRNQKLDYFVEINNTEWKL